jgi:hypothetical protein
MHWGWSIASAIAAGMLMASLVGAAMLLDEARAHGSPVFDPIAQFGGLILIATVFFGTLMGLAAALPSYLLYRWAPRGLRGIGFLTGAAALVAVGFWGLYLASDDFSDAIFVGGLLSGTALMGVFFTTIVERWTWTEPCAS